MSNFQSCELLELQAKAAQERHEDLIAAISSKAEWTNGLQNKGFQAGSASYMVGSQMGLTAEAIIVSSAAYKSK